MNLPFSIVKRLLQEADPGAQWSPEAVEAIAHVAEARIRELGTQAGNVARAQGRIRVQKEHLEVSVPTATGLALPAVIDANDRGPQGWRVQQALARANLKLVNLGQKPELLGRPEMEKA